ncbi:MAG: hypothetical protein EOP56_09320 [Sphingobacteriales bacterium]|nr:MAG: hypothetical protein EOP56_09320 [Sphingobacteriales bacterium]
MIQLTPNVICLELPEDAAKYRIAHKGRAIEVKYEDDTSWNFIEEFEHEMSIIGLLSDCLQNETLAEKVVEKDETIAGYIYSKPYIMKGFKEYPNANSVLGRATISLKSLISSHSLDLAKTFVLLSNKKETV